MATVSVLVISALARSRAVRGTTAGIRAAAEVSAITSATPSTRPASANPQSVMPPAARASSSPPTASMRMPSANHSSRRRSARSTSTPTCSAPSSQGAVRVSETSEIRAGDVVRWAAISGSAIFVTPSARLVIAVKTSSTAVFRERGRAAPAASAASPARAAPAPSAVAVADAVAAAPLVVAASTLIEPSPSITCPSPVAVRRAAPGTPEAHQLRRNRLSPLAGQ